MGTSTASRPLIEVFPSNQAETEEYRRIVAILFHNQIRDAGFLRSAILNVTIRSTKQPPLTSSTFR